MNLQFNKLVPTIEAACRRFLAIFRGEDFKIVDVFEVLTRNGLEEQEKGET